ncbi:hypothetical protein [Geomobilimonas luticola]|uniref:Uncharacterized protein n=1 Tax=Geomobilimonas luticola TaxID=1114878 RepID=A0ABS5S876_9BACT|nr:hypothetical protein [Geomobilimonas luticola]MBT0651583.1 hypothetical protein [Geomobilimonas luticola]
MPGIHDNIQRAVVALLFTLVCLAGPLSPVARAQGDQFLVSAFTPPFPIKSIDVEPFNRNDSLVKIVTLHTVKGGMLEEYSSLLLSRGITIYGPTFYGPFDGNRSTVDATITMTRKVPGNPDAVDLSTSAVKTVAGNRPVPPLFVNEKELIIPVEGDFGRKWQRLTIMPDREPAGGEPMVGRFPGAKLRQVETPAEGQGSRKRLVYATRAPFTDVRDYYLKRLKDLHPIVTVTGNPAAPPTPSELFGIRTLARQVTVAGYTYRNRVMYYTEVTLKQGGDPNLADYVEIEVLEN